jgi:hypothetical protein
MPDCMPDARYEPELAQALAARLEQALAAEVEWTAQRGHCEATAIPRFKPPAQLRPALPPSSS